MYFLCVVLMLGRLSQNINFFIPHQTLSSSQTMFIYPFKTIILKSAKSRAQIKELLMRECFLSDANYRKTDTHSRVFFGTLTDQDFSLETIEEGKRMIGFCRGEFRGADNEIYIFLSLGAWAHQRVFLLFGTIILSCLYFLGKDLIGNHSPIPQNPGAWILFVTVLVLLAVLYAKTRAFSRRLESSIAYFSSLWNAERIDLSSVPLVFH